MMTKPLWIVSKPKVLLYEHLNLKTIALYIMLIVLIYFIALTEMSNGFSALKKPTRHIEPAVAESEIFYFGSVFFRLSFPWWWSRHFIIY
jgi:hypothetical protein